MQIKQTVEKPQKPLPIVIIGAGGIVKDAHLPAYNIAGFDVQGVFDIDNQKAEKLKNTHPSIGNVYAFFLIMNIILGVHFVHLGWSHTALNVVALKPGA